MTQIALAIAVGGLEKEMKDECPFKEEAIDIDPDEPENIACDDKDSAQEEQDNNGGTLGRNLIVGRPGKKGTVGGPYPPRTPSAERIDTRRTGSKLKLRVLASDEDGIAEGIFPFTAAAHHCIPGDESLSPSTLYNFMKPGSATDDISGKSWNITGYIGYNVNGSHNGIWLPGNYAIRANNSPTGISWGKGLSDTNPDWCVKYVAAAMNASKGMFHDRHVEYSGAVKKKLNAISTAIFSHLNSNCPHCDGKTDIPPPYLIKLRLYRLSRYFRMRLKGRVIQVKRPWVTSDKWKERIFSGGKLSNKFKQEMADAGVEDRR